MVPIFCGSLSACFKTLLVLLNIIDFHVFSAQWILSYYLCIYLIILMEYFKTKLRTDEKIGEELLEDRTLPRPTSPCLRKPLIVHIDGFPWVAFCVFQLQGLDFWPLDVIGSSKGQFESRSKSFEATFSIKVWPWWPWVVTSRGPLKLHKVWRNSL